MSNEEEAIKDFEQEEKKVNDSIDIDVFMILITLIPIENPSCVSEDCHETQEK